MYFFLFVTKHYSRRIQREKKISIQIEIDVILCDVYFEKNAIYFNNFELKSYKLYIRQYCFIENQRFFKLFALYKLYRNLYNTIFLYTLCNCRDIVREQIFFK